MRLIDTETLIQNLESHKMTEVFPNWQNGMSVAAKCAVLKYANRIRLEIQNAPTVGRETLPQGEWLPPRVGAYGCTCSNCNKQADNDYDYCPNCGTKMGGTEG